MDGPEHQMMIAKQPAKPSATVDDAVVSATRTRRSSEDVCTIHNSSLSQW